MKKNKILIAAIIGIAVVIVGIIAAMFATGKFDSLRSNYENETTTASAVETTQEQTLPVSGRPKSQRPETVIASVYNSYSENSVYELALFDGLGFNTVIFELTKDNADKIIPLIETAKSHSLYFGIKADASADSEYITSFVEKNNVDFVIIGGCDETITASYVESVGKLCTSLKTIDSYVLIGLEPVIASKASESLASLIDGRKADFVFLSHQSGKDSSFEAAQTVWNEESYPLWLCHDMSGLKSYSTDKASAAVELVAASADMSMCKALAFYQFGEIANASGSAADIVKNYIKNRDTYLLDKEFSLTSHSKTSITVEQSKITFRGTSSPAHDLLCNGQKLSVAKNGDFSLDCQLVPGENIIKFEHKGKTYTYKVTYKIKLLKSVSPSEDISVPGGMLVEISAIALKDAAVTVSFNGKTYKMVQSDGHGEDTPDTASDFATFTASLETPQSTTKVQKLGKYKVTAAYNSLSESKSGANVTVTAKEVVTSPPSTQPPSTTAKPTTTQAQTTQPGDRKSVV